MTPKETVQALYAAYAAGDPDRIAALLHPDVIWVAPAGNAT
jgi:ketosteroid isomerase-like protein